MSDLIVPAIKKYDEALNKEFSEQYELSIQLSQEGFSFCIFHPENNKYLSIETIRLTENLNESKMVNVFEEAIRTHEWLLLNFRTVKVYFENEFSTLIPASIYDEKNNDLYARFNFTIATDHICKTDYIKSTDAYLIYTLHDELLKKFQALFPGCKFYSSTANLLESLLIQYKNLVTEKRMFVNVRNSFIDIVILEENKVLFVNSFRYSSPEDFIYFIIFVIEQLKLNPETIELAFSGLIDKNSRFFENVYQYIRHVKFQKLPSSHTYSYLFSEVPAHYFYNLLSRGI